MSDWTARAACKGSPVEWWFPPERGPYAPGRSWQPPPEALALCAVCPVFKECEKAGEKEYGVWASEYHPERSHKHWRRLERDVVEFERAVGELEGECAVL